MNSLAKPKATNPDGPMGNLVCCVQRRTLSKNVSDTSTDGGSTLGPMSPMTPMSPATPRSWSSLSSSFAKLDGLELSPAEVGRRRSQNLMSAASPNPSQKDPATVLEYTPPVVAKIGAASIVLENSSPGAGNVDYPVTTDALESFESASSPSSVGEFGSPMASRSKRCRSASASAGTSPMVSEYG